MPEGDVTSGTAAVVRASPDAADPPLTLAIVTGEDPLPKEVPKLPAPGLPVAALG